MAEDKSQIKSDTARREEEVLKFWQDNKVFEESLKKPAPKGEFVFYDGPPFATGLPHSGSLLSSVSKDVIPRYKTMRGYYVRRRWGWDTHGLPIESLVEKKLELKSKKDILAIGVKKFNQEARSMVLDYVHDWKRYIDRVGRWVDFENSYKTMDASYTESVWWGLKEIHKKGNLYEGHRVLMYCPHCETPLAKAEIAMDNTYKDVTDESVTVRFKIRNPEKHGFPANTSLLAWTTTPWTLPANSALSVGPAIEYGLYNLGAEYVIVALSRAEAYGFKDTEKKLLGTELGGIEYEPIFTTRILTSHQGPKLKVFVEEYVSTEDGTGVVHTGTIYGEEDYALIKKENLPAAQLLNASAVYNDEAPEFARGQYYLKANTLIIADLEQRGLLYKKEQYVHSYPHCYRCGTRLIYNAVPSWFINIQSVKDELLSENEKITWVPDHLKHGRFKNIVENAPDWTISRNRFWASPLPIWKDADGNVTVVGSLEELKSLTKRSGNQYYTLRHGESTKNLEGTLRSVLSEDDVHLTEKGKAQAKAAAESIKGVQFDLIFVSPFIRTRETADIARAVLGVPADAVIVDERLHEHRVGIYDKKLAEEYERDFQEANITDAPDGGESVLENKRRAGEFLYDIESKYQNKNILIVSHGWPIAPMHAVAVGADAPKTHHISWEEEPEPGTAQKLDFVPLPHNDDYELDYHLPFIDEIQLEKDGKPLKRIPEVVDCWVESGSMPFAEYHYPFENKAEFEKRTPGDFISEYIGQTRAWFYYMHAVSVHLFGHRAFNNVVTTGNVNAADGQKLSKSKKNYTDPYLLFDLYGADAFRYYLTSSVVMQAEDMQFKDDDLKEVHSRVINILRNVKSFYALYKDEAPAASKDSADVLDRWVVLRLAEVTKEVTESLDKYNTVTATRAMRAFIDDLSTWYVRRSRDRAKSDNAEDKARALGTLRYVLKEFSTVVAPVMPFIADEIYREVREEGDPISVHLTDWPETGKGIGAYLSSIFAKADTLIEDMAEVRELVSLALDVRQKAGIKVRQPLQKLTVSSARLSDKEDLLGLIRDELNVKEVVVRVVEGKVQLDTELTPALIEEGELRDLIREVQDLRKTAGLNPKDQAILVVPSEKKALVEKNWTQLAKAAGLKAREEGETLLIKL